MRVLTVASFAAIPLQWFLLTQSPAGDIRLHQLAAVVLTAAVAMTYGLPKVARGIRGAQVFVLANVYMLLLWVAMNVYNGLGLTQPIKQTTFLLTFIAVTALFFYTVRDQDRQFVATLRWTAATSVVVLVAAFGFSMLRNGVNPVDVLQRSIAAGDPNILQRELFRTSFASFGYGDQEARGNLRHEVFGGLLFTMYVSAWAAAREPFTLSWHRGVYRLSMALAALMLLISLSRSILVAAALWPLLSLTRALLTGRVSARQQLAVVAGAVTLAGLAVSGFLTVLWTRFTEETDSYTTREDLISLALERIRENFWAGGIETERTSSHNFVLDMWQRGGIFVGIPAVFIFVYISLLWLRLLLRLRTIPDASLPLVAAMALPCVRLVTQGGGSLQIVEWVALAFVLGVLAAEHEAADELPSPAARAGSLELAVARPRRYGRTSLPVRTSRLPQPQGR